MLNFNFNIETLSGQVFAQHVDRVRFIFNSERSVAASSTYKKAFMLVRLIYASRVTVDVSHADVKNILQTSQANNVKVGITGTLCFTGNIFLQCLEGERAAVNALYHRLLSDTRHSNAAILVLDEISKRDFVEWSMGYLGYTADNRALFLQYSGGTTLDPYAMSADALRGLFRDPALQQRWIGMPAI